MQKSSPTLQGYFDKIYCINLSRRTDRWQEMLVICKKENIELERFEAVDGNPMNWSDNRYPLRLSSFPGAMGCLASHLNVYKDAKLNNYEKVLIIEDDCDFTENINSIFSENINRLPEDWDLFYFGGMHNTRGGKFYPETITDSIVKAKEIMTTTCYAVRHTVFDLLINTLEKELPEPYTPIDGYLCLEIQPKCNTYAFHPPIAWQRASHSDVQNGFRNYSNIMKYDNIN